MKLAWLFALACGPALGACAATRPAAGTPIRFDVPAVQSGDPKLVRGLGAQAGEGTAILSAHVVLFDDDGDGRFDPLEEVARNTAKLSRPTTLLELGPGWILPPAVARPMVYWSVRTTRGTIEHALLVRGTE